mgnify:CR=1 FL=1
MPLIENPDSALPGKLQGLHLFHYDGAPCAQRVRFALGEKGLVRGREVSYLSAQPADVDSEPGEWISRVVSLPRLAHMTPGYAAIHPNMVVPALVHDGRLYLESLDIIEYLDETFGGTRLVPLDRDVRAATLELVAKAERLHRSIRYVSFRWGLGRLAMLNSKQRAALADLAQAGEDGERLVNFYEGFSTGGIPEAVYLDHLRMLFTGFIELDKRLGDGREFLMGSDISIADPFWSMKVLRMTECGYPIETYHPALSAWYQRVSLRPSFRNEVMGNNRLSHHLFRAKAGIEQLLGKGLGRAVQTVSAQTT